MVMPLLFHELSEVRNPYCISPDQFLSIVNKYPLTNELHFDDGRKGILNLNAVYLKNIAFRSTLFLVPNYLRGKHIPISEKYSRFLSIADVKELLKYGFEIGSHSLSHCNLTVLGYIDLVSELAYSKLWLEETFGVKVTKFSFPYGKVDMYVQQQAIRFYDKLYSIDSPLGIKRKMILQ